MVGTHARTITSNIVSGIDGKKDGKDESDQRDNRKRCPVEERISEDRLSPKP